MGGIPTQSSHTLQMNGSLAMPDGIAHFQLPLQAGLQLEFVYGYTGKLNTANNLFWTADNKIVYYVAAVGIVYDPETHTQQFFHVRTGRGKESCSNSSTYTLEGVKRVPKIPVTYALAGEG